MFGIEKDFQKLMEKVYGPLGKKEEEECDRIAKQLVDNAIEEVKKMTETPPTAEELQELLNGEDFYELLRKTPDPEEQKYIDKIWYDAIYKNLKNND